MSKNILILSSGFRRGGNSDAFCDASCMLGTVEIGSRVEEIFLMVGQV